MTLLTKLVEARRTGEHGPAFHQSEESCIVNFLRYHIDRHIVLARTQLGLSARCDRYERQHGSKMMCNSWFVVFGDNLISDY